jgi:hypothetical protein
VLPVHFRPSSPFRFINAWPLLVPYGSAPLAGTRFPPFSIPRSSLSLRPTFQSLDMDSAGPSSSAATAATGSPPAPPPLLRLPRFTLGFGNPSPCTVANTSVDDLVAQLLRVAYEGDRTKFNREFSRSRNFCSTSGPGRAESNMLLCARGGVLGLVPGG